MKNVLIVDACVARIELETDALSDIFGIYTATCKDEVVEVLTNHDIDIAVLEYYFRGETAVDMLPVFRKYDVPAFIITSEGDVNKMVECLEKGAKDYIVKPCSEKEVKARIRRVLRDRLQFDNIKVDVRHRKVYKDGLQVEFTPVEFEILEFLALNYGEYVSSEDIIKHVWGYPMDKAILRVNINKIRRKFTNDDYILTLKGRGYKLNV